MALEDALVVTKCLLAQSDFVAAFEQYESQRFPRAKSIVEQSLQSGQWVNWRTLLPWHYETHS